MIAPARDAFQHNHFWLGDHCIQFLFAATALRYYQGNQLHLIKRGFPDSRLRWLWVADFYMVAFQGGVIMLMGAKGSVIENDKFGLDAFTLCALLGAMDAAWYFLREWHIRRNRALDGARIPKHWMYVGLLVAGLWLFGHLIGYVDAFLHLSPLVTNPPGINWYVLERHEILTAYNYSDWWHLQIAYKTQYGPVIALMLTAAVTAFDARLTFVQEINRMPDDIWALVEKAFATASEYSQGQPDEKKTLCGVVLAKNGSVQAWAAGEGALESIKEQIGADYKFECDDIFCCSIPPQFTFCYSLAVLVNPEIDKEEMESRPAKFGCRLIVGAGKAVTKGDERFSSLAQQNWQIETWQGDDRANAALADLQGKSGR